MDGKKIKALTNASMICYTEYPKLYPRYNTFIIIFGV